MGQINVLRLQRLAVVLSSSAEDPDSSQREDLLRQHRQHRSPEPRAEVGIMNTYCGLNYRADTVYHVDIHSYIWLWSMITSKK